MRKWRNVIVMLLLTCNLTLYLARANVSIAILYMMDSGDPWQKWVLSAFFFGYFCLQLPGGIIASRLGGYRVLRTAASVWTIASLACVPAYKYGGSSLLVVCRVLVGLAEGVNYPAQASLAVRWFPEAEKTSYWALLGAGEAVGTIVAMASSPFIANAFGWEYIFYASGAVGLIWTTLFFLLAADDPESHRMISTGETEYIKATRPSAERAPRFHEIPWRAIFSNRPFLATCATHFFYNYSAYFALSLGTSCEPESSSSTICSLHANESHSTTDLSEQQDPTGSKQTSTLTFPIQSQSWVHSHAHLTL